MEMSFSVGTPSSTPRTELCIIIHHIKKSTILQRHMYSSDLILMRKSCGLEMKIPVRHFINNPKLDLTLDSSI